MPDLIDNTKCGDDMPMAGMPMATSLAELEAGRVAQQQAQAVAQLAGDYQSVVAGIVASDSIPDKGYAVVREASMFRQMLDSILDAGKSLIAKAGARHNKADQAHLQSIHDSACNLGALCEPMAEGKAASSFVVFKDLTGSFRWIGIFSNKFKDRDGEIIPDAAHKEFIAWLDAHPEQAPMWRTYHVAGTERKQRADLWDYSDGFMLISGKCTAEEAAPYLTSGVARGMSHGFKCNKAGNLITWYRTFEVSDLPPEVAANPWTDFSVSSKEANEMAFDATKRAYLVGVFGESKVGELEAGLATTRKALEEAGIEHKAKGAAEETLEAGKTTLATPPDTLEIVAEVVKAINLQGLNEVLTKQVTLIGQLSTQLGEQGEAIKALQLSDDAKIAKAVTPRAATGFMWERPSQATANAPLSEADKATVASAKATQHWLSQI